MHLLVLRCLLFLISPRIRETYSKPFRGETPVEGTVLFAPFPLVPVCSIWNAKELVSDLRQIFSTSSPLFGAPRQRSRKWFANRGEARINFVPGTIRAGRISKKTSNVRYTIVAIFQIVRFRLLVPYICSYICSYVASNSRIGTMLRKSIRNAMQIHQKFPPSRLFFFFFFFYSERALSLLRPRIRERSRYFVTFCYFFSFFNKVTGVSFRSLSSLDAVRCCSFVVGFQFLAVSIVARENAARFFVFFFFFFRVPSKVNGEINTRTVETYVRVHGAR